MPCNVEISSPLRTLQACPLLACLPEEALAELAATSALCQVARGDVVWLNGSDAGFFGVVAAGFIKMTRSTPAGIDVTTELMGPGQVFGLLGVVDGCGCPQTAQAVCDTWFLKVYGRDFLPVYQACPEMKDRLLHRTTVRLRGSHQMFVRMSSSRLDQRLASVLVALAESYGVKGQMGVTLSVPLTRQDLSEMAGTTVESTIRTLSAWQKQKFLTTRHQQITLCDLEGIRRAACG